MKKTKLDKKCLERMKERDAGPLIGPDVKTIV